MYLHNQQLRGLARSTLLFKQATYECAGAPSIYIDALDTVEALYAAQGSAGFLKV